MSPFLSSYFALTELSPTPSLERELVIVALCFLCVSRQLAPGRDRELFVIGSGSVAAVASWDALGCSTLVTE